MALEKAREKAGEAAKKAAQKAAEAIKKKIKQLGFNFFASMTPVAGNFYPAFTIFTWRKVKKNLVAVDAVLMLVIAVLFDSMMMILGLVDWGDFGIAGMIIRFFGWTFFYGWNWIRSGSLFGDTAEPAATTVENEGQEEQSPETLKYPGKESIPAANNGGLPKKPMPIPGRKAA